MSDVRVITPQEDGYGSLNEEVSTRAKRKHASPCDYDPLVKAYNNAPVDSLLVAPEGATTQRGNLSRLLASRGGTEGEDFVVTKPRLRADRSVIPVKERRLVVKKLSTKPLTVLRKDAPQK